MLIILRNLALKTYVTALIAAPTMTLGANPQYTVTDLGYGKATAINASGQVVGEYYAGGFIESDGVRTDSFSLWSAITGINDAGTIVGNAFDGGLLYSNGTVTSLNPGNASFANGINDSTEVVGAFVNEGVYHAFLYSGGKYTDLGGLTLGGGEALNINNLGQIVGWSYASNGFQHAFLYSGGVMQDLGTLGSGYSVATHINNLGQVVGYSPPPQGGDEHAFLYSNGSMQDLGTFGGTFSVADSINDQGQIVGGAATADEELHAFLDTPAGMVDLNNLIDPNSGWTLREAMGINNAREIVGYGINGTGAEDAFLLTPIPTPGASAIGMGLVALLALPRKRSEACHRGSDIENLP
ncbi:MAG TPA: hypothetical protein VGG19_03800 [Tepidisphaeraceae bacterium]|jgi:probable HAF family extracellular repeat protein